jgi:hypothetical protein
VVDRAGAKASLTVRERRMAGELRLLQSFIRVYCHAHHGTKQAALCPECASLLDYAAARLAHCPYDPKPKCKHCPTHCYRSAERVQMKRVMRYSGMWYVRHGRLDWLVRYFMS